jgi:hypothetical protein
MNLSCVVIYGGIATLSIKILAMVFLAYGDAIWFWSMELITFYLSEKVGVVFNSSGDGRVDIILMT